jgi:hypothetical protein
MRQHELNSTRIFSLYTLFEILIEIDYSKMMKQTHVQLCKILLNHDDFVSGEMQLYQRPVGQTIFQN